MNPPLSQLYLIVPINLDKLLLTFSRNKTNTYKKKTKANRVVN